MIYDVRQTKRPEPGAKDRAKVFMSGRSQAVRIPAEYRFHSSEVSIRRDPASGDLILSEGPGTWADVFAALDATGVQDGFTIERDVRPAEERPAIDAFFSGRRPRNRKK
jgi:antitoxin VapB